MHRVLKLIAVLQCLFLGAVAFAQEQPLRLENTSILATFDKLGLVSMRGEGGSAQTRAMRDSWSLTVGSDVLTSADATPTVKAAAGQLRYLYSFHGYRIEVIYRLAPEWGFLTKELVILSAPVSHFTVHMVEPLTLQLEEAPEDARVPGADAPQLGMTPEQTRQALPARYFGLFLRFRTAPEQGLMLLVENSFLSAERQAHAASLRYAPEMEWDQRWGSFRSDPAVLGPDRLTGRAVASRMPVEWKLGGPEPPPDGLDRGEIDAFTACVRTFLIAPAPEPARVEVGWTLNDYQVDVGTDEGKREYRRIIDATANLHIGTLLYSGANSILANRSDDTDSWHWEHTLWLNLGQKIRKGEWDPATSPIPEDIRALVAYGRSKGVGLLAYVFPSVPFEQNKAWLVQGSGSYDPRLRYASMSSRALQDMLLRDLLAFKRRTGIAGYSFDYTFLNFTGSSSYTQWWGWRRVMEELRRAEPDIVIDGRQSYQLYGPWSWLAGNYPHPTGQDEQPESFTPYPDLHFDRVSADRTRYVNYWYRNYQFAPSELVPGYATHQTERSRNVPGDASPHTVELVYSAYSLRDWDELGFRYSFLSSIGTGGWNNVVNMIPARDPEEAKYFPAEDQAWIRNWLDWTRTHKDLLRHTRTILHAPAMNRLDGTAAIDGDRGFLFLFNPNYRSLEDTLRLDEEIGLTRGQGFLLCEVYPNAGRLWGKPGAGLWQRGDNVPLSLGGTSATMLELIPAASAAPGEVFNASAAAGKAPHAALEGGLLTVTGVAGEPGTAAEIGVPLREGAAVKTASVNGKPLPFRRYGNYVTIPVKFAGQRFTRAQQITLHPDADGGFSGTFIVPRRVLEQLRARAETRPIAWTEEDRRTAWLAPERLLLFFQAAEARDGMAAQASVDGAPLEVKSAYTATRVEPKTFVGLYADLSAIVPDTPHTLKVKLSGILPGTFQGAFFDNVEPQLTTDLTAGFDPSHEERKEAAESAPPIQ